MGGTEPPRNGIQSHSGGQGLRPQCSHGRKPWLPWLVVAEPGSGGSKVEGKGGKVDKANFSDIETAGKERHRMVATVAVGAVFFER